MQTNAGITLPLNSHDRQRVDEYLKGYYWDIHTLRYEAANTDRHRRAVRRFYRDYIIKASTAKRNFRKSAHTTQTTNIRTPKTTGGIHGRSVPTKTS